MRFVRCVIVVLATLLVSLAAVSQASAARTIGWTIRAVATPTYFSSNDALACESEGKCDRYQLLAMNVGDEPSSGTLTLTDRLPPGMTFRGDGSGRNGEGAEWSCTEKLEGPPEQWTVTCEFGASVPAGGYAPFLKVTVFAPSASMSGSLKNEVSVTGGGTTTVASASEETPISSQAPEFGVNEFGFEADGVGGATALQAGAHPWSVTTSFGIPTADSSPGIENRFYTPVEQAKDSVVELPTGFVGNPQAAPHCTQTQLRVEACPPQSRVGAFAVRGGLLAGGEFGYTEQPGECCSAVYNMVPEGGYPAEFGFKFATIPVYLYASVVRSASRSASGYRVRVASPGIPAELETSGVAITFFGDPGKLNGGSSEAAFLTNPADCSAGPLSSRIELESWENPGHPVSREATAYSQLTGCDLLPFHPSLAMAPSTTGEEGSTQADSPSAYTTDLDGAANLEVLRIGDPGAQGRDRGAAGGRLGLSVGRARPCRLQGDGTRRDQRRQQRDRRWRPRPG